MNAQSNSTESPTRNLFTTFVVLALIALGFALAYRGYGFYRLDLAARAEHRDYRVLGPSGVIGHGYGMVGTLMMLTNLLYLLRRRMPHLKVGSMRAWLDLHVFTGLAGALLVLFHSAFQLRTPLASASAVSVGFVVVTGLLGRYMVAFAPRADTEGLRAALGVIDEYLPGVQRELTSALNKHRITTPSVSITLFGALRLLPTWRREGKERSAIVKDRVAAHGALPSLPPDDQKRLAEAIETASREAAREAFAIGTRFILDSWRGFHRFFAFLLVVSVTVHSGVAWYYGFRWIFSAP